MFPGTVPQGIGIIGGEVSGGLEVFDFEDRKIFKKFRKIVNRQCPGLLQRLPTIRTPREAVGYHIYIWSDSAGRSQVLARDEERKVLIELKGECGYVVAPGSDVRCHATRRPYEHISSTPAITEKSRVSAAEREVLIAAARSLDRSPPQTADDSGQRQELRDPDSPGNIYSRSEAFEQAGLLERHGWEQIGRDGDRVAWKRPGKDTPGVSAYSGRADRYGRDVLCVYSSSASPLEPEFVDVDGEHHSTGKPYTLFAAYAALEHNGDYRRAALHLSREGYTVDCRPELCVTTNTRLSRSSNNGPLLWRPFPLNALPSPVREYVDDVARSIGCDPVFVVLPLLAVLAGTIGNSRRFRLRDRWKEPCVIWSAVLAHSGSLKSPAMDFATMPAQAIQSRMFAEYHDALAEYNETDDDSEVEEPVCNRLLVTDVTVEALVERLQQNPRGLLLAIDELAGFILSLNQYKRGRGSDTQHWLSMHGARQLILDRKGQEPVFVPHAAVSVCGPIPPAVFKRVMFGEHAENGMLARFLIAMPPSRSKRWNVAETDVQLDQRMRTLLWGLASLETEQDENTFERPLDVCMTSEAEAVWREWYDRHAVRQEQADAILKPAYAKLEAYAARIGLVIHLVRQREENAGDNIDAISIASAVEVTDWLVHEVTRVYAILHASGQEEEMLELAELVRSLGDEATPRELMRHASRYETAKQAKDALDQLVERGWAEWQIREQSGPGRRSRYVRLTNDNIDTNRQNDADAANSSISSTVSPGANDNGQPQETEVII